jgi:Fur family ferric uptake transcriptional regulator
MARIGRSDELDEALHARGLRSTPQRRLVFDAVSSLGHATPDQVCEQVQQLTPSLNLSTVYRALDVLEDLGVISHSHLGHGAPTYHVSEHADHIHLVCRRCGAVGEADMRQARALAEAVARKHGFCADLGHLSLHGLCRRCRAQDAAAGREAAAASRR